MNYNMGLIEELMKRAPIDEEVDRIEAFMQESKPLAAAVYATAADVGIEGVDDLVGVALSQARWTSRLAELKRLRGDSPTPTVLPRFRGAPGE